MPERWREVRVFVSSTFRDMQAERDHLVKVVFPELRERLEKHRVYFVEIDLRWGVTQEQSDNDEALELCLEEIDRCRPEAGNRRPFFIGILGQRYGWVPETVRPEVLQRYSWIADYPEHSVTALEIIHGVLLNPPMQGQSFFYLRHPAFMDDVPQRLRRDIMDAEDDEAREKLRALKQRIRKSGFLVMDGYPCGYAGLRINWRLAAAELDEAQRDALMGVAADGLVAPDEWAGLSPEMRAVVERHATVRLEGLEAFGNQVRDDLWEGIARQYPEILEDPIALEPEAEDPLAVEQDFHERFAESRLRIYVGREQIHGQLVEYLDGETQQPLAVVGPSGCGKSAILARLYTEYAQQHPDTLVLPHFVGASASSTSVASMLRRLCACVQGEFGFPGEIPDDPTELPSTFRMFLGMVPADRRAAIIIDALDQLDERDREAGLHWLPTEFPPNIKLVVSCLDDSAAGRTVGQGLRPPPTPAPPAPPAPDPHVHGAASDAPDGSLLHELHNRGHPQLRVEPLTEDDCAEIIDLVPSLSAKMLDAEQRALLLANPATRNPLYLQVALEELRGFGSFEQLNARIVQFAEAKDVTEVFGQVLERLELDFGQPLVQELTCLLAASRAGLSEQELAALFAETDARGDMHSVLRQLRTYLLRRGELTDYYHRALPRAVVARYQAGEDDPQWHLKLADYFDTTDLALRKVEELPWQLAQAGSWQPLYDVLADLPFFETAWRAHQFEVKAYWAQVEGDSPLRMVGAYRPVLERPAGHRSAQVWLVERLLADAAHPTEALGLRQHLVQHYRQAGDRVNLQASLGNQAVILAARGQLDEAMALHKEQERICRDLGNRHGLQIALGNQALILYARGQLDEAMALWKEQERICRELGDKDGLRGTLGNQAVILRARGQLDEAMALHKEEERICRELGNKDGLSASLGNQALILQVRGELDEAMALHKEQERICRELGDKHGLQACLGNQAVILKARGQLEEAMALHKEEERLCRELANKHGLQLSLGNQALILHDRGQLDEAMALHKEKERICRELGNKDGLSRSLGNQALILKARGQLDEAMALHKDAERICRELGDKHGVQACLGNQAVILKARGQLEEAMALHKEEERLCRELANKHGLQLSLGNQALILHDRGQLDEAMALHKEKERICRELGNPQGLATSLANQASLLAARMGRPEEALVLAEEAYRLATDHGLHALAGQIKPILESVRSRQR